MVAAITLYDLKAAAKGAPTFSPHVWKTKFDLAILGLDHQLDQRTFVQINGELKEEVGGTARVTVPTIKVDGKYVVDSWKIAEWFEENHAAKSGKSLFLSSEAGKSFCKFMEAWANTELSPELRTPLIPCIYDSLDTPSAEYFCKARLNNDPSKIDAIKNDLSNPERLEKCYASARARLTLLESQLAYQKAQGKGAWLGGEPSHADGCVFGYYGWSRLDPGVVKNVWEHESLPNVKEWLEGVKGLFKGEEFA